MPPISSRRSVPSTVTASTPWARLSNTFRSCSSGFTTPKRVARKASSSTSTRPAAITLYTRVTVESASARRLSESLAMSFARVFTSLAISAMSDVEIGMQRAFHSAAILLFSSTEVEALARATMSPHCSPMKRSNFATSVFTCSATDGSLLAASAMRSWKPATASFCTLTAASLSSSVNAERD